MIDKEEYQDTITAIIEEHGHFVQGVMDGPDSFAYTIGRTAADKPEFYFPNFHQSFGKLMNEIPDRYDVGY